MFIKLQCRTCDNIDCELGRKVIPEDSLEGCTREVSEDLAAQYYHATEEVLPFVLLGKNPETSWGKLEEISCIQEQVYQQKVGSLLDSKAKKRTPNTAIERSYFRKESK